MYGPYDNFESENAMVIPSLVKRAVAGDIRDGTTVRVLMNTQQRKVYEVEIRE